VHRKVSASVAGWYISVEDGKHYFVPVREYCTSTDPKFNVLLRLEVYSTANITTLPESIVVSLWDNNGTKRASIGPTFEMYYFSDALLEKGEKLNILLFGLAGSSKSSFINSCYSLFSPKIVTQIAHSGGAIDRVTKEMKPYRMIRDVMGVHGTPEPGFFSLIDTWGLEQNEDYYREGQFELILQGRLPKGWQMGQAVTGANIVEEVKTNEAVHCVVFFVPVGELTAPQNQSFMLRKTKEFCATATRMHIPFLVAISKMDMVLPAFRDDPSKTYPEAEKIVMQAAQQFSIAPSQVYPLINYTKETDKVFALDKQTYKILHTAYSIAKNRRLPASTKSLIEDDY